MLPKKNVTEEDVKATEARLAGSYAGLKQALMNIPSEAVRPVTDTVRAHPYATVAAAAGAGYVAFRLLDVLMPRMKVTTREVSVEPGIEVKGIEKVRKKEKRSLASRLFAQAVAFALPYITGYVKNEVARLFSKPEESKATAPGPEADE